MLCRCRTQGDLFAEEQVVGRPKDKKWAPEKADEPGAKIHLEYRYDPGPLAWMYRWLRC